MFKTFLEKLTMVFKDSVLRKRVLFTLGVLVIFRLLATIPIPGIDAQKLSELLANNQFLGLITKIDFIKRLGQI